MNSPTIEVRRLRLTLVNGGQDTRRAEHIARLALGYASDLLEGHENGPLGQTEVETAAGPPVSVPLGTMEDASVARACAAGIYRTLTRLV